jgi:hypothetical protein
MAEKNQVIFKMGVGVRREMYQECRHIKANGHRCESPALENSPYCYFHARLHRRQSALNSAPSEPADLPAMEDKSGIQLALAQILGELRAKRLTAREAGLALYAIQIASNTMDRRAKLGFSTSKMVRSVSHSEFGDELAPECQVCEGAQDCADCPDKDTCEDYEEEEVTS